MNGKLLITQKKKIINICNISLEYKWMNDKSYNIVLRGDTLWRNSMNKIALNDEFSTTKSIYNPIVIHFWFYVILCDTAGSTA